MSRVTGLTESNGQVDDIKTIGEMEPLEIRVIQDYECRGHVVMRTASLCKFEVMDLSDMGIDSCWTSESDIKTVPYTGDSITLKVVGDE